MSERWEDTDDGLSNSVERLRAEMRERLGMAADSAEAAHLGSIHIDQLSDGRYATTVATPRQFHRIPPTQTAGTAVLLAARIVLDARDAEKARLRALPPELADASFDEAYCEITRRQP